MNGKNFKKILFEEIDYFVDKLDLTDKEKTKHIINELFTLDKNNFLKDMGAQDVEEEQLDSEMDEELWDWFLDTCSQSIQECPKEWINLLRKEKMKTLCYKYFTKKDLIKAENIEGDVRKKIRKYFTALQNFKDLKNFEEKISNLPSELLMSFTRFIFSLSDELKSKVIITKKEFKKRVDELKEERIKMIDKISLISKKYQTILDITKLKELSDNGLFFEDNLLNRGVNEYIFKLLNNETASKKIKDEFSNTFSSDLMTQTENAFSYAEHIKSIKAETGKEFFTENGYQIGNRYENEIQIVKDHERDNEIIDSKSIFKEPTGKIKDVALPWETNNNNDDSDLDDKGEENDSGEEKMSDGNDDDGMFSGGGGGGGSFDGEGGDFSFEEPDEEGVSPTDVETNETIGDGTEGGKMGDMDTETDLPKNDQGFPVDFGSEESNPEAADSGMKTNDNNNSKDKENK